MVCTVMLELSSYGKRNRRTPVLSTDNCAPTNSPVYTPLNIPVKHYLPLHSPKSRVCESTQPLGVTPCYDFGTSAEIYYPAVNDVDRRGVVAVPGTARTSLTTWSMGEHKEKMQSTPPHFCHKHSPHTHPYISHSLTLQPITCKFKCR